MADQRVSAPINGFPYAYLATYPRNVAFIYDKTLAV